MYKNVCENGAYTSNGVITLQKKVTLEVSASTRDKRKQKFKKTPAHLRKK